MGSVKSLLPSPALSIRDLNSEQVLQLARHLIEGCADAEISGIVFMVAMKDGSFVSSEAFTDDASQNPIMMSFIARLIKIHEEKFEMVPEASECPKLRIVN